MLTYSCIYILLITENQLIKYVFCLLAKLKYIIIIHKNILYSFAQHRFLGKLLYYEDTYYFFVNLYFRLQCTEYKISK